MELRELQLQGTKLGEKGAMFANEILAGTFLLAVCFGRRGHGDAQYGLNLSQGSYTFWCPLSWFICVCQPGNYVMVVADRFHAQASESVQVSRARPHTPTQYSTGGDPRLDNDSAASLTRQPAPLLMNLPLSRILPLAQAAPPARLVTNPTLATNPHVTTGAALPFRWPPSPARLPYAPICIPLPPTR